MIEARWPNVVVGQDEDVGAAQMASDAWRKVTNGSAYGRIVDPGLRVNHSWEGALATLNVAHQWDTWTRRVTKHEGDAIEYPKDLPGLAGVDPTIYPASATLWDGCEVQSSKCNQYWLSGKREALDAPREWFHDAGTLYFYEPSCAMPNATVEVKARNYAIWQDKPVKSNVRLASLELFGAALQFRNCTDCVVNNVVLSFPTYDPEIRELNAEKGAVAATLVAGTRVNLTNLTIAQSNNWGLELQGDDIVLDNFLIASTDWVSSLNYAPLKMTGNGMVATRGTVRTFGNAGIVTAIPNSPAGLINDTGTQIPPQPMAGRSLEVSYCHVYDGGKVGEDTALLYGGGWAAAGTRWHHNWIHGTMEKCLRFDDQSENSTVDHNVLYDCGEPAWDPSSGKNSGLGLVAKGDGHYLYANTIFQTNYSDLCMPSCVEKSKPYRTQFPRVVQNNRTQVFNSAAATAVATCECPAGSEPGGNFTAIYKGADLKLRDAANHDYRPADDSPLVDAGAIIPPYTDGFVGAAPDIGAYESGGDWWQAGCVGLKGC